MEKVYIVTSGEYSDYHICKVFSTKEKADEYVDARGSEYSIEEWEVDKEFDRGARIWEVSMSADGKEIIFAEPKDLPGYKDCISFAVDYSGEERLVFYIETDSMTRAVKIASERYGAVIANEQTHYPLLRVSGSQHSWEDYPMIDFYTGEIVIMDEEQKSGYPPYAKFKLVKHE